MDRTAARRLPAGTIAGDGDLADASLPGRPVAPATPAAPDTRRRRGWLVHRALLVADLVGLTVAFLLSAALVPQDPTAPDALGVSAEFLLFVVTLPAWVVVAKMYRLYDRDEERTDHTTADDLSSVFHLVTVGCWLLYGLALATGFVRPPLERVFGFWALAILLVTLLRALARTACRRHSIYLQNMLIVGAGDVGQLIAHKLLLHPEYAIRIVGFVDAEPKERREDLGDLTVLGPPELLPDLIDAHGIDRVVFAFSGEPHEQTLDLIRSLKDRWIQVDIVPRFYEVVGPGVGVHTIEGIPIVSLAPLRLTRSSLILKRAVDLTVAAIAVLVLAPVLMAIAVAVKLDSRGPLLFRQLRMGAGGQTFRILKFRTMAPDADAHKEEVAHLNVQPSDAGGRALMFKIPDDPRMTRVGRFLRRFSLDELPQLFNVLRGEMSLVGPRPLILDEDHHVREWARRRLDLKPGMTGLWQVLGRSDIPFEDMVRLDYLYVTSWSVRNDCMILLRTIPAVLRGSRG